jgi:hypothetical protein
MLNMRKSLVTLNELIIGKTYLVVDRVTLKHKGYIYKLNSELVRRYYKSYPNWQYYDKPLKYVDEQHGFNKTVRYKPLNRFEHLTVSFLAKAKHA